MVYYCKYCGNKIPWTKNNKSFCNSTCMGRFRFSEAHKLFHKGEIHRANTLKSHLLSDRGYKCEICQNVEWVGKPIPLLVDHINGDWRNDFPNNLRLVCGNCDMQLPTYKAKNKGKGRPYRRLP